MSTDQVLFIHRKVPHNSVRPRTTFKHLHAVWIECQFSPAPKMPRKSKHCIRTSRPYATIIQQHTMHPVSCLWRSEESPVDVTRRPGWQRSRMALLHGLALAVGDQVGLLLGRQRSPHRSNPANSKKILNGFMIIFSLKNCRLIIGISNQNEFSRE